MAQVQERVAPGIAALRHVIVVMLENRSFDHLLGYLDHPDPTYNGGGPAGWSNPRDPLDPSKGIVWSRAMRSPDWTVDPDHSHAGVMAQLGLDGSGAAPNCGFVASYARRAAGDGERIMWCWDPAGLPVLSTLAREFAVCTQWFSSVPGETWPNRQFAHAATSAGFTDIEPRLFHDRTIFELLEAHGHDWGVYIDGPAQLWCYPALWRTAARRARWHAMPELFAAIAAGSGHLPAYCFVEPNHGFLGLSYSQHPGNNRCGNSDVRRAEGFVAAIYEALRANPTLFEQTLLVVTWDEHGGAFDSARPNPTVAPDERTTGFDFRITGARVPALLVSPWISRHAVDATAYEHASIPATLRAHFAPAAEPLTARDAACATLLGRLDRTEVRRGSELPNLDGEQWRPRSTSFVRAWLASLACRVRRWRTGDRDEQVFDDVLARLSRAVAEGIAADAGSDRPAAPVLDEWGTEVLPEAPRSSRLAAARAVERLTRGR